jgi:hypothetical protein
MSIREKILIILVMPLILFVTALFFILTAVVLKQVFEFDRIYNIVGASMLTVSVYSAAYLIGEGKK